MKNYVAEFQKKIAEIDADSKNINIINAGIMNHGKSSLFNSLMDKEIFAAQDVRTTVVNQNAQWFDNVYLIDTPGLEAEKKDDTAAYDAYRRANMIIFVHNVKVGELHEKELAAINKIKSLFNDDDFFCKHFCLTLTFMESEAETSILSIRKKSLDDIKSYCGISDFANFIVSNSRYQKGVAENKKNMIRHSGIPELRDFLTKNFQTWFDENNYFRAMRISNEKNSFVQELQQERGKIQARIDSKTEDIKRRQQNRLREMETANSRCNDAYSEYDSANDRLEEMQRELEHLRDNWRSSRANYDN